MSASMYAFPHAEIFATRKLEDTMGGVFALGGFLYQHVPVLEGGRP